MEQKEYLNYLIHAKDSVIIKDDKSIKNFSFSEISGAVSYSRWFRNTDSNFMRIQAKIVPNVLKKFDILTKDQSYLEIAIGEAVANAWEHGNKKDPTKYLNLYIAYYPEVDVVQFGVTDQGGTYDPSKIDLVCKDENGLPKKSMRGRGSYLMATILNVFASQTLNLESSAKNCADLHYTEIIGMMRVHKNS
jgi:anti-sigma regulatory factor (Ser/Thr protein kinase)